MKCEFCEQEFSDAVYPLHIERCEKRVLPGTEAQIENEVNGNIESLENESAVSVQGTENDVMEMGNNECCIVNLDICCNSAKRKTGETTDHEKKNEGNSIQKRRFKVN